ncbi:STAS domain-containing protein [Actinoplanes sp. NPDC049802]|uniref:STAS domain-containing protein n=1 Tax=Actinoplanes sp. NPDC049802 TaxID=3154742 RepID=UPI0033C104FA
MTDDYFTIAVEHAATGGDGAVASLVRLAGELDIEARDRVRDTLLDVIEGVRDGTVVVDLGQLRFIDSEGISALIEGYLAASSSGGSFRVVNANGIVKRVITVTGLEHLLCPP